MHVEEYDLYIRIQQEKLERKHLINFFRQLTLRDRVKFSRVCTCFGRWLRLRPRRHDLTENL